MYIPRFSYPFIYDGHLGCFHILTVMNNAAMNMGVYISLQDTTFKPLPHFKIRYT